ncbi:MAG: hypothetical protein JNJ58_06625 [Chitinophagaceae bacterium]|nr:hypothetical protein [Chitinophagaceae bacterium]
MKLLFTLLFLFPLTVSSAGYDYILFNREDINYVQHMVAANESVAQIAEDYFVDEDVLVRFNHLGPTPKLIPGQRIDIPLTESNFFKQRSIQANQGFHPVWFRLDAARVKGDLCWTFQLDEHTFNTWNRSANQNEFDAGEKVIIGWLKYARAVRTESSVTNNEISNNIDKSSKAQSSPKATDKEASLLSSRYDLEPGYPGQDVREIKRSTLDLFDKAKKIFSPEPKSKTEPNQSDTLVSKKDEQGSQVQTKPSAPLVTQPVKSTPASPKPVASKPVAARPVRPSTQPVALKPQTAPKKETGIAPKKLDQRNVSAAVDTHVQIKTASSLKLSSPAGVTKVKPRATNGAPKVTTTVPAKKQTFLDRLLNGKDKTVTPPAQSRKTKTTPSIVVSEDSKPIAEEKKMESAKSTTEKAHGEKMNASVKPPSKEARKKSGFFYRLLNGKDRSVTTVRNSEPKELNTQVPKTAEETKVVVAVKEEDKTIRNEAKSLNLNKVKTGKASYFFSGPSGGKFYVVTNLAPIGAIVKVTNTANGRYIMAEVMNVLPSSDVSKGLILKVSDNAKLPLGQSTNGMSVKVNY